MEKRNPILRGAKWVTAECSQICNLFILQKMKMTKKVERVLKVPKASKDRRMLELFQNKSFYMRRCIEIRKQEKSTIQEKNTSLSLK